MAQRSRIRTVSRLAWLALGLWVLAGVGGAMVFRGQLGPAWAAPRVDVPVVVIESDDWGLDFEPPHYVPPGAAVDARQQAGVRRLADMLATRRDAAGRPAIVSAFIVVHQADSASIAADPAFAYHPLPIDRSMPKTVAELKQAAGQGVLELVYHGRDHRDVGLWCNNIRAMVETAAPGRLWSASRAATEPAARFDPESVRIFHPRDERERDRIVAEYFDSRLGYLDELDCAQLEAKVKEGLAEFERIFARRPVSTVPPRYLWGPAAEKAFAAHGIRYLHGANKQGGRFRGEGEIWARPFGVGLGEGLIGIPRNTDVEVRPDNSLPSLQTVMEEASRAAATGQPIVICTHACNYATDGPELGDKMCDFLGRVLDELKQRYPDLRYLSAEEAGRLAERGEVVVNVGGTEHPVRLAGPLKGAWLAGRDLYLRRAKIRLYALGLALLAVLALAMQIVSWIGRRKIADCGLRNAD